MKKITLILLALCLAATLVFSVACTSGSDDTTTVEGGDVTTPDETQGGENLPETADPEDEGFITVEPVDNEEKWGDLVTSAD